MQRLVASCVGAGRHGIMRIRHQNPVTRIRGVRTFAQLDFVDQDQGAVDLSERKLVAQRRWVDGTRACNKLREEGLIPGIVYGLDESGKDRRLLVSLPRAQLQRELNDIGRAVENTLYTIEVEDESFRVLPRNLQHHPTKEIPVSVNYLCHNPKKKVKVKVPLEFFNLEKCTGLKQGGRLEIAQRDFDCYVVGDTIPRNIRVNMAGYSIGESITISNLEFPEHLTPLRPAEMVFKITGRRGVKL